MNKIIKTFNIKSLRKNILAAIFLLICFSFLINIANAQETFFNLPGIIEGNGTHFEIIDSQYLNITLDSSEQIKARIESIPEMLTMIIEASSSTAATSTKITISGFTPSITYYKYQDDYHNLTEFISDENGVFSYIQDISSPHFIFIQIRKSTKFIRDNATGGDCYLIGNWDITTKTCILTTDLTESVQFDNDGIALNGNNHTIMGYNTGIGIYFGNYPYGRRGVTVKNLNIKNLSYGVYLWYTSDFNNFINNTFSNNYYGAVGVENKYNNFFNNTFSNNNYGLNFSYVNYYQIFNNNFINNLIQARVSYWWPYWQTNSFNGNYWSNYDIPTEGCNDSDNNKICDSPYIFDMGRDNSPWIIKDGWNIPINQPPTISNINQYKSDGQTLISEDGITAEEIVVFKATLQDQDNDQVKLQIELKEFNQVFDGQNLLESDLVLSGSETIITRYGLVPASYHWRARAVDDKGNASDWQEFGTAGDTDFEIKLVPLYTQVVSDFPSRRETESWSDKPYAEGVLGNYDCGLSIANCGCAITSMVMLGRYYGIDTGIDNTSADPGTINTWLTSNSGYTSDGRLWWSKAINYLGFIDRTTGKTMARFDFNDKTDWNVPASNPRIDDFINAAKPIVVYSSKFGHYFIIDNKLSTAYGLKDPAWYNTKTLNDPENLANRVRDYNNHFNTANLFSYLSTPKPITASISLSLASPAELLIIDPLGRKLGRDPIIDINYNEIPDGIYSKEGPIVTSDVPLAPEQIHESKIISIPFPIDGQYDIQVIGIETGTYALDLLVYNQAWQSKSTAIEGTTAIDNIQEFDLSYFTETSEETEILRIINIDIKPDSYPNSINLKSKGVIPVAVLTDGFFNAKDIVINSVIFAGASLTKGKLEDIDNDGDIDLILHFNTQSLQLDSNSIEAVLTGQLTDGILIKGTDSVKIIQVAAKQTTLAKLLSFINQFIQNLFAAIGLVAIKQ